MAQQVNLTKVYRRDPDGRVVTVQDAIVDHLRAGNYVETAAAAVGVNRTSLHRYLARGAKALRLSAETGKAVPKPDKVYADFSARVQEAASQAEAAMLDMLTRLASGGLQVTETSIEYVLNGDVRTETKRTETTRNLAPNVRAIMWRLERRNPGHWGRAGSLAPMTEDGAPVPSREERIDSIEAMLTDYQTGYEDGLEAAKEQADK